MTLMLLLLSGLIFLTKQRQSKYLKVELQIHFFQSIDIFNLTKTVTLFKSNNKKLIKLNNKDIKVKK